MHPSPALPLLLLALTSNAAASHYESIGALFVALWVVASAFVLRWGIVHLTGG